MLNKITVTFKAVSKFQTVEYSAEISDPTSEEITQIKNYVRDLAISGVNELAEAFPEQPQKQQAEPKKSYNKQQYQNSYKQLPPRAATQPQQFQNVNEPATESQLSYLQNLGYAGDYNLTKQQAKQIIAQITGR